MFDTGYWVLGTGYWGAGLLDTGNAKAQNPEPSAKNPETRNIGNVASCYVADTIKYQCIFTPLDLLIIQLGSMNFYKFLFTISIIRVCP